MADVQCDFCLRTFQLLDDRNVGWVVEGPPWKRDPKVVPEEYIAPICDQCLSDMFDGEIPDAK